jgi:hypothetical protein
MGDNKHFTKSSNRLLTAFARENPAVFKLALTALPGIFDKRDEKNKKITIYTQNDSTILFTHAITFIANKVALEPEEVRSILQSISQSEIHRSEILLSLIKHCAISQENGTDMIVKVVQNIYKNSNNVNDHFFTQVIQSTVDFALCKGNRHLLMYDLNTFLNVYLQALNVLPESMRLTSNKNYTLALVESCNNLVEATKAEAISSTQDVKKELRNKQLTSLLLVLVKDQNMLSEALDKMSTLSAEKMITSLDFGKIDGLTDENDEFLKKLIKECYLKQNEETRAAIYEYFNNLSSEYLFLDIGSGRFERIPKPQRDAAIDKLMFSAIQI